jgi:hypothetical protein
MPEIKEILTPDQIRQLKLDLEQLKSDGYGEAELRDYVKGFKDGFVSNSPVGLAGNFANGLLLGYGDEAKGGLRSLFSGQSRLYETARARAQISRSRQAHPVASLGAEVAGSVAPAVLGGLGVTAALGRAATTAGNIGRGMAAGGLEGAVYGSGNEVGGVPERLGGAVEGGVIGTATGAAAVPALEAGRYVLDRVGRAVLPNRFLGGQALNDAAARRTLRTTVEESNATPATVRGGMETAQRVGVPTTMGEQIGPQGVDVMESAAQAPGPGRQRIAGVLEQRQVGQPARLENQITRRSGVNQGSLDTKLQQRQARRAASDPHYRAMAGQPLPSSVDSSFRAVLATPAGRRAYRRAADMREQMVARGEPVAALPDLDAFLRSGRVLTADEADLILQGLEDTAQRAMTPGPVPGRMSETGDSIQYSRTAQHLRGQMQQGVPEFAQARAAWAGPSQLIEGIDLGRQGLHAMDLDTFRTTWAQATPAAQDGMRIGLINELKAQLQNYAAGPTSNAARLIAPRSGIREKIRTVLGPQADELLLAIDLEYRGGLNTQQVLGNSATARRLAAAEAMADEPLEGTSVTPQGILARVLGKLDNWAQRRTREALAQMTTEQDPAAAETLVQRILNQPLRSRGAVSGALVGGPAGAVGASVLNERRR